MNTRRRGGMKLGHSFLPAAVQAVIEEELRDGRSISAVAMRVKVSRDQVRTIHRRMVEAGWQVPADEIEALRARLAAVEADLARIKAQW